jgi:WD40 repeat protein
VTLSDVATGRALKRLRGHTGEIPSLAYSPDGSRLVTGSRDHTIRIWDVARGLAIKTLKGGATEVLAVAWSPDGTQIASSSSDKTTRLWDAVTGEQKRILEGFAPSGERFRIGEQGVAFSPDGKRVASSIDIAVRVWDARTGAPLLSIGEPPERVNWLGFSPDGKELITESQSARRTWNLTTGTMRTALRTTIAPNRDKDAPAVHTATTPDGAWSATADEADCVQLSGSSGGSPIALLCAVEGKDAGYVFDGQHVDFVGMDACAAHARLACRVGHDTMRLPFELCEEHFVVTNLLGKLTSSKPVGLPQDEVQALACDSLQ